MTREASDAHVSMVTWWRSHGYGYVSTSHVDERHNGVRKSGDRLQNAFKQTLIRSTLGRFCFYSWMTLHYWAKQLGDPSDLAKTKPDKKCSRVKRPHPEISFHLENDFRSRVLESSSGRNIALNDPDRNDDMIGRANRMKRQLPIWFRFVAIALGLSPFPCP